MGRASVPAPAGQGPWEPDRDQARRLLQEELASPEYAEARPNPLAEWLRDALGALLEWFDSVAGAAPSLPGWILPLILVVVAVVVLLLVRPRTNAAARAGRTAAVLTDRTLGPDQHRRAAQAAAAAGDHGAALAAWYRALVREAEVRTVLTAKPGRTATEAAGDLETAFPTERDALHSAAEGFNAVVYGDRAAGAEEAAAVRDLDGRLRRLVPDPSPAASPAGTPGRPVAPR